MSGPAADRCTTCHELLDTDFFASCSVCDGRAMCIECARAHLCTAECRARGCIPGLCVKVVRDGVTAEAYGVDRSMSPMEGPGS
jgi:hypothetical protein